MNEIAKDIKNNIENIISKLEKIKQTQSDDKNPTENNS